LVLFCELYFLHPQWVCFCVICNMRLSHELRVFHPSSS
jgi:hypothetical protein